MDPLTALQHAQRRWHERADSRLTAFVNQALDAVQVDIATRYAREFNRIRVTWSLASGDLDKDLDDDFWYLYRESVWNETSHRHLTFRNLEPFNKILDEMNGETGEPLYCTIDYENRKILFAPESDDDYEIEATIWKIPTSSASMPDTFDEAILTGLDAWLGRWFDEPENKIQALRQDYELALRKVARMEGFKRPRVAHVPTWQQTEITRENDPWDTW